MIISDIIKTSAIIALAFFTVYIIQQNKDTKTKKRWMNIYGLIVGAYFTAKLINEFFPEF